jgi:hypothetical protein
MKSIRLLDRRAGYSLASIGLLLGIIAPTAMPAFASADVLTSRSVTLTSSAADAPSVGYDVKFTAPNNIDGTGTPGGVVIYFCDDSPLLEASCNAPSGLTTTSVSLTTTKYGGSTASSVGSVASTAANSLKWTAAADFTGGATLELQLAGIHNPSATGTFYARITTYADSTDLTSSTGTDATAEGTYQDDGAVALSTANTVGVTAYVLESMTFCVSGAAPSENCGAAESGCPATSGCVTSPDMTIGETTGSVIALDSTHLSTGQVYAQLSTNASGGAVVNLKSNAVGCGGLFRNGVSDAGHCNIAPQTATATGFSAGTAMFGLTVGSSAAAPLTAGGAGTGSGTLAPATGYDATHYYIDAATNNSTGVTSTYGSALLTTSGTQTNNLNVPITFGASVSSTTPAGVYGATFGMIATGTF